MKRILFSISILSICVVLSCSEDEACGLNGQANGECFQVELSSYDVQTINTTPSYTRENLFLSIQFDTGSERYRIGARSDQYNGVGTPAGGVDYRFENGTEYVQNSMIFNGNINAPATGTLTVIFSQVDRVSGMVSGSFVWVGEDTGSTTSNISGSFNNVAVSLSAEQ